MKEKLIIGFAGRKQAGKTTAAVALQAMFSEHAEIMSFASPLKKLCKEMFGLTHEQMTDPSRKEQVDPRWNLPPRQIMQKIGKMFRDEFGADYWVRRFEAERCKCSKPIIILDDCRYPNEAKICDHLAMVHRPSLTLHDNHESENPPHELAHQHIINIHPNQQEYRRFIRASVLPRIIEEYLNAAD